jgi:hypothetical protein
MSMTNGKPLGRPPHRNSKHGPAAASDAIFGEWSRGRLLAMDRKFCERLERAIKRHKERRESATGVPGVHCVGSESSWQKPAGDANREAIGSSPMR